MSADNYRLVFNGLTPSADLKKLVVYFRKDLGLPPEEISTVINNAPRVLRYFDDQQAAEFSQSVLAKMGCFTRLEPVVTYPYLNFTISQKHDRLVKKELSKVLRCRTSLVMLLVQIEQGLLQTSLPSMMGAFEDQLIDSFRESDTVISIDDSRVLLLGFATDKAGAGMLQDKACRIVKKLLGEEVVVKTGYSMFPEDAQSLEKLLYLASRPGQDAVKSGVAKARERQLGRAPAVHRLEKKEGPTPLQICFTKARGKIFKRLLNMDSQTLCLGLSKISRVQQKEFLCRLPIDSPLIPALEEYVNNQPDLIFDPAGEGHFNAVINQMELEAGLANRDELQDKLLFRLRQGDDLPTLPSIAVRIFNIASDPEASGTELLSIIRQDPALTSKILKTVNSAFYGNPQKISSVRQALILLGNDEIVDLAFGLAAAKVFDIKPVQGVIDPKFLWHHSICTALIARDLCRGFPQYKNMSVFTAGLLHDVGKIFFIEKFADIYREIYADKAQYDMPLFELEEDYLGMNHAIIGNHLSSNWNLPQHLVQAISHHHQPTAAAHHPELAALIGLANYLYYKALGLQLNSRQIADSDHWLTVGHWTFLTRLFPDMGQEKLDKLTAQAESIIKDNQDCLVMHY
ncbi:MAG: HDOD domain-containing protein [Smithellaceae bacterium]